MRREERTGKGVVVVVSSPASSCHLALDENKLNGKILDYHPRRHELTNSERAQKHYTAQPQQQSNWKGGSGSGVSN